MEPDGENAKVGARTSGRKRLSTPLPSGGVPLPSDGVPLPLPLPSDGVPSKKRRFIPPSPPKSPQPFMGPLTLEQQQSLEAEVVYVDEEDYYPIKRPKYPLLCDSAYRDEDSNTDHEAEDPELISDYSGEDGEEPESNSDSDGSASGSDSDSDSGSYGGAYGGSEDLHDYYDCY